MPSKPTGRSRKKPSKASRAATPTRKKAKTRRAATPARSRARRTARSAGAKAPRVPRSAVRPAGKTPVAAQKTRSLTKRALDVFRRLLEVERDRLADQLDSIEEHLPEVENVAIDAASGYDEDLADVASETFERERGIAIENSEQDLLQQVEEALARITSGKYGVCLACGSSIHRDRLRALPWARLCIDCAKAREEQAIPR